MLASNHFVQQEGFPAGVQRVVVPTGQDFAEIRLSVRMGGCVLPTQLSHNAQHSCYDTTTTMTQ